MVQGSGFMVQGFKVQGSGFKVQGFKVQGSGFMVQGSRVQGSGFKVQGSGFMVFQLSLFNFQLYLGIMFGSIEFFTFEP